MRDAVVVLLAAAACCACTDDVPPPSGPQGTSHIEEFWFSALPVPKLDLLFVIDDTTAMAPYQDHIARVPDELDSVLSSWAEGVPDLHVAVTTNGGALRRSPQIHDPFIADLLQLDRTRIANYQGTLEGALRALVTVGAAGTGESQPFAAMKTAVETPTSFHRQNAALAIFTIAATDDASPDFDYVQWLKNVNNDPATAIVSGIYKTPSARLDAFHNSFPNRSAVTSIDRDDWTPAFSLLTQLRRFPLGLVCIEGELVDIDLDASGDQYDCNFVAVDEHGVELETIPRCGATQPCWDVVPNPQDCFEGSHLSLRIYGWTYHPEIHGQCLVK